MDNRLYQFTMRVLRASGTALPEGAAGAYVPCYACAPDPQSALRKGAAAIGEAGCRFDDIDGPVREIAAADWAEYVAKVWPDQRGRFPSASELPSRLAEGAVFFGPFAVFNA